MVKPLQMLFLGVFLGSVFLGFFSHALRTKGDKTVVNPDVIEQSPLGRTSLVHDPILVHENANCSLNPDYPESINRYCNWITNYAQMNDLDPNLIAAVITQESDGNPQAISSSGAVGLMQVMPRDGLAASFYCINGPCFSSRPGTTELLDPEYNIKYGTDLLAGLIKGKGNTRDGLMAYGPENSGYFYADTVLGIYEQYQ